MTPRIVVVGLALLVGCPLAGAGLAVLGGTYALAEPAPRPTVNPLPSELLGLCNGSRASDLTPNCYDPQDSPFSTVYVAPGHLWIVAAYPPHETATPGYAARGDLFELGENGSAITGDVTVPCEPYYLSYPGTEADVLVACTVYGESYGTYNDSLLWYDWETGEVTAEAALAMNGCYELVLAPPAENALCLDWRNYSVADSVYLRSFQGATGAEVGNVSLDASLEYSFLAWDVPHNELLAVGWPADRLLAIDPATGNATVEVQVTRDIAGGYLAPNRTVLYLAVDDPNSSAPGDLVEVNMTTLRATYVSLPFSPRGVGPEDPGRGELWVPTLDGMQILNESTWRPVENLSFSPDVPIYFTQIAPGAIVGLGSWAGGTIVYVIPLTYGTTTAAPYSSVPLVGASLPYWIAIPGALVGAALLVREARRRARQRRRAAWEAYLRRRDEAFRPPSD